ncbi:hypothetical protein LTR10_003601 [Elasticomyces elasticus]|nr:hypothetical protein LTR10_003601 [Elasticomyces elasticus]KAK4978206.1 hypothetical protein LTR42_002584 [Elasticomyces elasticus]
MADDLRNKHLDPADTQQIAVAFMVEARTDGTAASRLFGLPAELRVAIYEYNLVQHGEDIPVDARWQPPALLRVSWRISEEASSIYYDGNTFTHDIQDCNADLMLRWIQYCFSVGIYNANSIMLINGRPNWTNLMRWCEALCEGKGGISLECPGEKEQMESVMEAANEIAVHFCRMDKAWQECKPVLEALRRTVGTFEPEWLE